MKMYVLIKMYFQDKFQKDNISAKVKMFKVNISYKKKGKKGSLYNKLRT